MVLLYCFILHFWPGPPELVCESPGDIDLNGVWVGENYQCPKGTYHREYIRIIHQGCDITAVKLSGDACIPSGYTTFKGRFDQNPFLIDLTIGYPGYPTQKTREIQLLVIHPDTIVTNYPLRFIRQNRV